MDDLNIVVMTGRLVFDPEITESTSGKKKVKIRIAVSRGKDKQGKDKGAYFFNGQAFGRTADAIAKYAKKGRFCNVVGKLCEWSYEKDDEKRYYTVINIDTLRLLDKPKNRQTDGAPSESQSSPPAGVPDPVPPADDDDLPF